MSFPPGPPLPMPGMPPVPPMMPPPYAVPPMGGMIPMTVGMMPAPMMAPVAMPMPAPIPMPQQRTVKKINTQNTYRKYENHVEQPELPKGPPVTVFVGNITDRAPDTLVRQILQRCGIVLNWKRVQGANGKLQAFGFCEYGDPESALRAMRLLHDYELGEKKLVVKVDAKTKEKLDEYKANKLAKLQDEDEKNKKDKDDNKEEGETSDDALDEMTKQRDNAIITSLQALIHAHAAELSKPSEDKDIPAPVVVVNQSEKTSSETNSPKPRIDYERLKKNELDEMDLEEDKKSLIHREIDKFRDTYKRAEEEKEKDKERRPRRREYESPEPRSRDRDRDRDRDRERERERDRDKRWSKERSLGREERSSRRRRSRERDHKSPRESPVVTREHRERSRERQVERQRSVSRDRNDWNRERERSDEKTTTVSRPKEKEYDKEEEEDAYERKKQERKIREKEALYQDRLRNWVARERRKAKEYEKEKIKAEEQKKDEAKEARRLKEFLEDYDDEKDDPKYFKGSALVRRMKEREKEIEEDMLDRQREKEELDELRKKLVEEGHPDPEAEVERLLLEESRLMEPPKPETPESDQEPEIQPSPVKMRPISKAALSPVEEKEDRVISKRPVLEDDVSQNSFSGFSDVITQQEEVKLMGFTSLRLGASPTQHNSSPSVLATNNHTSSKRKVTVDDVFNVNDEETETRKKRKLIPLDDTQDDGPKTPNSVSQMTNEEKRKHIKSLIEKIPTEKSELFAYNLDWKVVDSVLMEKRIRPWINKKIVEYIGEEEPTLVEFICSKIMAGSAAQSILDDVSMVLDEEAEVFVVKMWRLLIYEIEAKKLGLVCKPDSASQENMTQSKT
ncbi:RNA-binding protein 25-like isoform X2 [Stegodyphus dumicola]|nr:RNA-binding protein 25-like isoform X2 [Stegodyphus dumicola]